MLEIYHFIIIALFKVIIQCVTFAPIIQNRNFWSLG